MDLCAGLGNAPEMQKCPKTFVHDCRPYYGICALFVVPDPGNLCISIERTWKPAYRCPASSHRDDSDANVCQACGIRKSRELTQGARSNADRPLVNL